jgi:16S rRNA (guanine1207-N2)-methyltransferase
MGEHYSSPRPSSRRRPAESLVSVRGLTLRLRTDAGVFARSGLDRGTELLIEALDLGPCELVLDLGCGTGAIGLAASRLSEGGHVVLTDINERAVRLARENLRVNAVANAEVRKGDLYAPVEGMAFDHIVSNPPLRAGRAVVDRIVSEAPAHLLDGGRLWLVARTRQGAEALRRRMADTFGDAAIVKRGSGYKVLRATKEAGP